MSLHLVMQSNDNNTHRGTAKAVLGQGSAESDALKQTGCHVTDRQIEQAETRRMSPTNRADDLQAICDYMGKQCQPTLTT